MHPDSASVVSEPAAVKVAPRTPYDAKFSLPWSVAALLLDGDIAVATYDPGSVARPEVAALAGRVRTVVTGGDGVAADAPGHVRVTLRDGSTLEGAVNRSTGGPQSPLSDADLHGKFLGNAGESARGLAERAGAARQRPVRHRREHRRGRRPRRSQEPRMTAPFTAIEPAEFPWFEYRGFTFSLGLQLDGHAIDSGHSGSAFDPQKGRPGVVGDMAAQARTSYAKHAAILAGAGLTLADATRVVENVTVAGLEHYPLAQQVRRETFGDHAPSVVHRHHRPAGAPAGPDRDRGARLARCRRGARGRGRHDLAPRDGAHRPRRRGLPAHAAADRRERRRRRPR